MGNPPNSQGFQGHTWPEARLFERRSEEFAMTLTFENGGGVGTDQQGAGSGTTSRSSRTLGGNSNVTGEGDGVSSTRGGRLDAIGGVENGGNEPGLTGVLDGSRLVDGGLGADFQTIDGLGVDVVLSNKAETPVRQKGEKRV